MRTPYFSRREVLQFLLSDDARRIEAGTEDECWRKVWRAFMPKADELCDDGLFLEFERVCQIYGFGPTQDHNHVWEMQAINLAMVTL